MKIGDLVTGVNRFEFGDFGIGIIIGKEYGRMKVYWPEKAFWCYTALEGVKPL